MEKQNVTLSLPVSLLRKAKALAAEREKSLSGFLRESLEEKIKKTTGYEKARQRQLRLLRKGIELGTKGRVSVSREELHGRR